ncbi:MAG: hypothetical protein KF858_05065 [Candidatus Sumerlaeia bacterium]|nr:hypothetical protein [Candidatus Sumerlaeia bacterium]
MTKKSSKQAGPLTELDLVCSLVPFLVDEGYDVKLEVSNMGQSIDLVGLRGNNRWLTAIEVKRTNWKRALEQCQAHALVCDYIAIALALKGVPKQLSHELNHNGWGLLLFNHDARTWDWTIRPVVNRRVWKPQRTRFLMNLREISHAS